MTKTLVIRHIAGVASSIAVMAALFFVFMFWNPWHIYQVNLLNWIPMLTCILSIAAAGGNRETPIRLLPFLFVPFAVFDLFKYFCFPFILALLTVGVLTLVVVRPQPRRWVRTLAAISVAGIFVYVLFSQPLRIDREGAISRSPRSGGLEWTFGE